MLPALAHFLHLKAHHRVGVLLPTIHSGSTAHSPVPWRLHAEVKAWRAWCGGRAVWCNRRTAKTRRREPGLVLDGGSRGWLAPSAARCVVSSRGGVYGAHDDSIIPIIIAAVLAGGLCFRGG
jgi:hypothetical protein